MFISIAAHIVTGTTVCIGIKLLFGLDTFLLSKIICVTNYVKFCTMKVFFRQYWAVLESSPYSGST